ncbi:hypothetical protein [Clostridium sp. Cult2]|uniref:hypothetical protein n=1 Tax=Clostridium sp. Cult2 TaxID=2079003 RepID=UPI001F30CBDB|nr:hypothetical protein [Clostridium sp. Cult2]MCF6465582.1 hypothetical protein [Clostridium sp. Cult2]
MNKNIVRKISSDLNINKYNNESNEEYGNRLIYTAFAAWARTLVLGKSYTDLYYEAKYVNANYHNVDIMHIQVRLTQIAYGFLMSIPHSKDWFINSSIEDQCSDLASTIIENLIFCYELSKLNDSRRLTNSPIRHANFKNNQLVLGGEQWKISGKKLTSVGLGRWIQTVKLTENYKEIFNIPKYSSDEYYNTLVESAFWKESNLNGRYKIFKVGTNFFYYKAWQDLNISKIPQGISLLKNIEVDGGYILVKKNKDAVSTARLDKWYYDENEIYRIMYVLDSYNETPATFQVEIYDNYVILHCHSKLPNPEMRILLMSSWPKRFYNDIFYRIIPRFLWNDIEDMLVNLGIKIEYINS